MEEARNEVFETLPLTIIFKILVAIRQAERNLKSVSIKTKSMALQLLGKNSSLTTFRLMQELDLEFFVLAGKSSNLSTVEFYESMTSKKVKPVKFCSTSLFDMFLRSCENLTTLSISSVWTTKNMLISIRDHCNKLHTLSASLSPCLSQKDVLYFCFKDFPKRKVLSPCCKTIKTLEIGSIEISDSNINFCPSTCICEFFSYFEQLRILRYMRAGDVVNHLRAIGKSLSKDLVYFGDRNVLLTSLKTTASTYEKIETVHIFYSGDEEFNFPYFPNLTALQIGLLTKWDTLQKFAEEHGKQLEELAIYKHGSLDISVISQCCPNLKKLGVGSMFFRMGDFVSFPKVESLEVMHWNSRNGKKFFHFLRAVPNLKTLKVWRGLKDEDIFEITKNCLLLNLVSVHLVICKDVSLLGMKAFIESYDKLERLGNFYHISKHSDSYDGFKKYYLHENIGVHLYEYEDKM